MVEATSRPQVITPGTILMREGELKDGGYVLLSGFAYCFKLLTNGERQIVAYRMAGDADGLYGIPTYCSDYTVMTLTPCEVAFITRSKINDLITHSPNIARALWWSLLTEKSDLCALLINIGQRPAPQRLAYLSCALLSRLQAVGLTKNDNFKIQLTLKDFADMVGITEVHVCRVFKKLRELDLLAYTNGNILAKDFDRLKRFADFEM